MAYPFPSRSPDARRDIAAGVSASGSQVPWRCTQCAKLLGVARDGQMHIRFSRGHEYFTGFPVTAICRHCGTLNRAPAPAG